LTLRFRPGDDFESEPAHTRPLLTPIHNTPNLFFTDPNIIYAVTVTTSENGKIITFTTLYPSTY
jgi:hypothetical protein